MNNETLNNSMMFVGSHIELDLSFRRAFFLIINNRFIWIGLKKQLRITMVLPDGENTVKCRVIGLFGFNRLIFKYKHICLHWDLPILKMPNQIAMKNYSMKLFNNEIDCHKLLYKHENLKAINLSLPKIQKNDNFIEYEKLLEGNLRNTRPNLLSEISSAEELQINDKL